MALTTIKREKLHSLLEKDYASGREEKITLCLEHEFRDGLSDEGHPDTSEWRGSLAKNIRKLIRPASSYFLLIMSK